MVAYILKKPDKTNYRRSRFQLRVEFRSVNLEVLETLKRLIYDKFSIQGSISSESRKVKSEISTTYKLRYIGKRAEALIKLIWSYKRRHNIAYRKYKRIKYGDEPI